MAPRVSVGVAHFRADWTRAILVCGKCSRKLDGGFGPDGDQRLAKALRRHFGLKKGRKATVGVVEVGCLGACPKRAVTIVDSRAPGAWRLIRAGTPVAIVAAELGLAGPPPIVCY